MTKDFTIATIDVHPGYGADCKNCPLYNDLALLKLTDHIQFDKNGSLQDFYIMTLALASSTLLREFARGLSATNSCHHHCRSGQQ